MMKNFPKKIKILALIGVDGAGKTTTAMKLKEYFENQQQRPKVIYMGRGRNRALPGARDLAQKVGLRLPAPQQLPELSGVKKKALYLLRDLSYVLDAYARYFLYIIPSLLKGETVITDRYAYDILLNEEHHNFFTFLLLKCYPRPDYIFYLYHDPQTLKARKDERTPQELARQIAVLRGLKEKLGNMYELKTEGVESTLEKIIAIIERKQNAQQ
ncbi:MAG: hypothetical protein V1727_02225 [Candidatus Omnitrophota bacterium]